MPFNDIQDADPDGDLHRAGEGHRADGARATCTCCRAPIPNTFEPLRPLFGAVRGGRRVHQESGNAMLALGRGRLHRVRQAVHVEPRPAGPLREGRGAHAVHAGHVLHPWREGLHRLPAAYRDSSHSPGRPRPRGPGVLPWHVQFRFPPPDPHHRRHCHRGLRGSGGGFADRWVSDATSEPCACRCGGPESAARGDRRLAAAGVLAASRSGGGFGPAAALPRSPCDGDCRRDCRMLRRFGHRFGIFAANATDSSAYISHSRLLARRARSSARSRWCGLRLAQRRVELLAARLPARRGRRRNRAHLPTRPSRRDGRAAPAVRRVWRVSRGAAARGALVLGASRPGRARALAPGWPRRGGADGDEPHRPLPQRARDERRAFRGVAGAGDPGGARRTVAVGRRGRRVPGHGGGHAAEPRAARGRGDGMRGVAGRSGVRGERAAGQFDAGPAAQASPEKTVGRASG